MNEEYKFGEAIPAKDGKRWSDDPEVYALIVENERLRWALDNLIFACELPGNHCEVEQALPHAKAALQEQPR